MVHVNEYINFCVVSSSKRPYENLKLCDTFQNRGLCTTAFRIFRTSILWTNEGEFVEDNPWMKFESG